ncbi:MAG: hypothetical protein V3U96_03195 [Paracoccaceae bacterium]
MNKITKQSQAKKQQDDRHNRLKAALKANMGRRKAQAQARKGSDSKKG